MVGEIIYDLFPISPEAVNKGFEGVFADMRSPQRIQARIEGYKKYDPILFNTTRKYIERLDQEWGGSFPTQAYRTGLVLGYSVMTAEAEVRSGQLPKTEKAFLYRFVADDVEIEAEDEIQDIVIPDDQSIDVRNKTVDKINSFLEEEGSLTDSIKKYLHGYNDINRETIVLGIVDVCRIFKTIGGIDQTRRMLLANS